MKAVSNTGPIIGPAEINKIDLLQKIFSEILIPPMVQRKLLGKAGEESVEIDRALKNILRIQDVPAISSKTEAAIQRLDAGEKQAIALASTLPSGKWVLLMDDRAGREAAQKLNLPITGLVGLLLDAKDRGAMDMISDALKDLREHGYWLSDSIIQAVKKLAKEQ